jgi:hypothetical protein
VQNETRPSRGKTLTEMLAAMRDWTTDWTEGKSSERPAGYTSCIENCAGKGVKGKVSCSISDRILDKTRDSRSARRKARACAWLHCANSGDTDDTERAEGTGSGGLRQVW